MVLMWESDILVGDVALNKCYFAATYLFFFFIYGHISNANGIVFKNRKKCHESGCAHSRKEPYRLIVCLRTETAGSLFVL